MDFFVKNDKTSRDLDKEMGLKGFARCRMGLCDVKTLCVDCNLINTTHKMKYASIAPNQYCTPCRAAIVFQYCTSSYKKADACNGPVGEEQSHLNTKTVKAKCRLHWSSTCTNIHKSLPRAAQLINAMDKDCRIDFPIL